MKGSPGHRRSGSSAVCLLRNPSRRSVDVRGGSKARAFAALAAIVLAGSTGAQAQAGMSVGQLLKDGYEIKTAFYDNGGGAYIILQRGTSAYMCHSNPTQICEKLN